MDSISPPRLRGQVALVTGAVQGIGWGVAQRLAREGASVVLNGRHMDARAERALSELRAAGAPCEFFAADVARVDAARRLVQDAAARFGRLDILVNNAGIERNAGFADVTEEDWDAVLDTNLKGPFFLSQAFARAAGRGARIVNVSSVHEELPFPHFAPYCASKGGLKMITRTLALELAPLGISVNNVAPGAIRTPINGALLADAPKLQALRGQIPAGHLGEPQDVAGVVAFLCSQDARYMTGTTVFVDGGLMWNYSEQ
jgi:glucose 1-dehydrogenase